MFDLKKFVLLACSLIGIYGSSALADDKYRLRDGQSATTPAAPSPVRPVYPRTPECVYPTSDWRCRPRPPAYPDHYHRRPVIVNQIDTEPPVDISSLSDDWEGCRAAKLGAIRSRDSGQLDQANDLDEWLWKNCRSYSIELRALEGM